MKSILVVLSILCFSSVFSQSDFDERLLSKFSENQLTRLATEKPQILDFWTFYLDNSYAIVENYGLKEFSTLGTVKIKNQSDINIFEMGLPQPLHSNAYYEIKNSDKILVLISRDQIAKKFNN